MNGWQSQKVRLAWGPGPKLGFTQLGYRFPGPAILCGLITVETTYLYTTQRVDGPLWFEAGAAAALILAVCAATGLRRVLKVRCESLEHVRGSRNVPAQSAARLSSEE